VDCDHDFFSAREIGISSVFVAVLVGFCLGYVCVCVSGF
jgi:hypothetical protein